MNPPWGVYDKYQVYAGYTPKTVMRRCIAIALLCLLAACSPESSSPPGDGAECDAAGSTSESTRAGIVPTELVALSGRGKIFLAWNAPPGASLFKLYRGTSAGSEDAVPLATNVGAVSYLDTAVVSGTRYFYRVAIASLANGCGRSPFSNEASARPIDADPVGALQSIVARANPFAARTYVPAALPTFDVSRLPQPIIDDHPEWVALYERAWELAFKDLKQPTATNGFVSNFIDPAFFGHIFQWDTIFMLQFAKYAHPTVEVVGSLDNFYAKQHSDGFICREINEANGKDIYFRSIDDAANPPLYSWAEWQHYRFTGDRSRLDDVLVPIAKHYDWLKKNRTRSNGAYWNTGFGAGEDDLQRGQPHAWMDMTAQQTQNALFAGLIATETENDALAAFFLDEYLALGDLLRDKFWDRSSGVFSDLRDDEQPTGVKTVLTFWPLLAHVGSFAQAQSLVGHLQDPAEFWRPNLIPVLAADEPGYTPEGQYWNGSVWAPTNYMAINALQDYGFQELASSVARTYLANMAEVFAHTGTIWEHYAPESATGEGLKDFVGWSGLGPIALLIESVLGIHVDGASNSVVWRPMLPLRNGIQNLSFGSATVTLLASPITDGQRTLSITTSAPLRLAVDTGVHQATCVVPSGTTMVTVPASSWEQMTSVSH